MKSYINKFTLGLALFFVSSFHSYAQEQELNFDKVEVIKDLNVEIGNFNKVNIDPVLPVYDIKSRTYNYNILTTPAKLEYEKPQIRPLALKPENSLEKNKYFFKVGYGMPKMLNLGVSAGYEKKSFTGNFYINHLSSDNSAKIKDQINSQSELGLKLKLNNEIRKQLYTLNTKVQNDYYYLFSDANTDSLSNDAKRRFLYADIGLSIEMKELGVKWKNNAEFGFKTFQYNAGDIRENSFNIHNTCTYKISESSDIKIPLNFEYSSEINNIIFGLKPHFAYSTRIINLKAGLQADFSQDNSLFTPYIDLSASLFHNFIELFANYGGELYNNTMYFQSKTNPFLSFENIDAKSTQFNTIEGGIRNSLEGAKIELKAGYQKFENLLFFALNPSDLRTFISSFVNGNNFILSAKIIYEPLSKFKIGAKVEKNSYKLEALPIAPFMPDFSANVFTDIRLLRDKIIVGGEVYFGSAPWFLDLTGNKQKLDPLLDLNSRVKFVIAKRSGFFVNINNIFAQKYQRWYKYPNHGLNLLVGLEIRF